MLAFYQTTPPCPPYPADKLTINEIAKGQGLGLENVSRRTWWKQKKTITLETLGWRVV